MNSEEMNPEKLLKKIDSRLRRGVAKAWKSPGGVVVDIRSCEDHMHVQCYPAVREISGGPEDGKTFLPPFIFDAPSFSRYLDHVPRIAFDCQDGLPKMIMYGEVLGVPIWFSIMHEPPENNDGAHEIFHKVGPKSGQIEIRQPKLEDEEDD